jgi:hypothetical protein
VIRPVRRRHEMADRAEITDDRASKEMRIMISPLDRRTLSWRLCERALERPATANDDKPRALGSLLQMKEVQEVSRSRWGFGGKTSFHYDALTRSLWFYDAGAAAGVVAQAEVVGSFSTKTSTWLWSWANEGSTSDDRARFGPLRVLGEVRGIAKLAGAQWEAEEVDGWEVTQIAGYILGAEGIYRAPMRHLMVFFLLQRLREEPLPRELLT